MSTRDRFKEERRSGFAPDVRWQQGLSTVSAEGFRDGGNVLSLDWGDSCMTI